MPTYIILSKWTDQGIRNVDQVADRERSAKRAAADMSGAHTVYFTLGEYDAVNIVEAPDETAAAAYALEIASHGNIRTTTMRAFTEAEFLALLKTRPRWETGAEGDLGHHDAGGQPRAGRPDAGEHQRTRQVHHGQSWQCRRCPLSGPLAAQAGRTRDDSGSEASELLDRLSRSRGRGDRLKHDVIGAGVEVLLDASSDSCLITPCDERVDKGIAAAVLEFSCGKPK